MLPIEILQKRFNFVFSKYAKTKQQTEMFQSDFRGFDFKPGNLLRADKVSKTNLSLFEGFNQAIFFLEYWPASAQNTLIKFAKFS